ncbi:MAG: ASCH domain-containing protein [Brevundimonas sp.]|uniref:ASCH domain-containing protein n=1 Tax=Brevundimonas sp. TaxID=1871086 RepID=UPI0027372B28|nr:ASCH domain-containing protein [Brevundimonas sp.]MDP3378887.1 ASCH domain-containing protein [Brevundimonas sp.]
MAYLFSIKPEYCDRIYDGAKTVELRRRVSPKIAVGSLMLIYETMPTKAVTGSAVISDIRTMDVDALWEVARTKGGIERDAFYRYFSGLEAGHAIALQCPLRLENPIPLADLIEDYGLQAPQSYREITDRVTAALLKHGQIPIGHQHPDPGGGRTDDPGILCLAAA